MDMGTYMFFSGLLVFVIFFIMLLLRSGSVLFVGVMVGMLMLVIGANSMGNNESIGKPRLSIVNP